MKFARSMPTEPEGTALVAGRYQIVAALGRGGAAQVWKVKDLARGGVSLALKRLAWSAKPRLAAQFELEYQTLASLKHPRIVEVFDYGRDNEGAFYTMELLEGEDLRDHAPTSWRETCSYLRDAAEALSLLHARRLVHRDIGPRNLWRCPDGAVKLIDFGALTQFGPVDHLMGTPPFIPPEALHGQELDQRADLYALGALAYYLLTGLHAYPASDPRELADLWQKPPPPPSLCVAELAREDLDQVPAELDGLVAALLSQNVLARPNSAAEVIDRLDVLLGSSRTQSELGEVHLSHAALVGRERALRRLRRHLALAARGRGRSCVIESASGVGRSRMLRELELLARVSEVSVLHVDAGHAPGAYGVAGSLGVKLLEALPEAARAAAAPHAALLAQTTVQLRDSLAVSSPKALKPDPELAVRIQSALCSWFLEVAKKRPLVILVDGLELLDPGSSAFLLALVLALKQSPVFVAGTLLTGIPRAATVAERELSKASHRLLLESLTDAETLTLMESVFGRVEHVARLTSHLQRTVHGNPGHLLDLCGQLLHRNVIGFTGGGWVLPLDVPEGELSGTRREVLLQRLERLSTEARELGRVLSVHDELISPAIYRALAALAADDPFRKLGELLELEVLTQERDGLRFRHEEVRRALDAELPPERRATVRRALGEQLLALPEIGVLARLRAGVHLLAGGEARGAELVTAAGRQLVASESAKLNAALADLEEALSLFRAQGRPSYEQLCLLVPLAIAGFRVHRRYAIRHGEETVLALEQLLGLDKARQLRPKLGARLGLVAGLAYGAAAARARRKNRCALSFKEGFPLLFNVVAALSAASSTCLDVPAARRYAHVLEPFSAFGSKQLAGFTYDFCRVMAESSSDQPGRNYGAALDMLQRLEHGDRVRGLSKGLFARYVDGVLLAKGALEAQRDDELALATAQRLSESRFVLSQLTAEQIRGLYYAHQGNVQMFERCRQRAEHLAIQQGATWQVETWATCGSTAMYMRVHDAMGMKQACEQLDRLSRDNPSLELHARRARGAYLLMRGRYAEALPWLEECLREEPRTIAGWARAMGCLARARNRLGEHAAARDLCLRITRELDRDDLEYQAFNLLIETELAIAQAGLGQAAAARRGIERLLLRHGKKPGPLTLGEIHEAGLEVELLLDNRAGAVDHFAEMKRWYTATGASSLAQRCEALHKHVNPTPWTIDLERREISVVTNGTFATATRRLNTVDRLLAGGRMSLAERAQRALQILAEKCGSSSGALYLFDGSGQLALTALLDAKEVEPAADAWARDRVASAAAQDGTVLIEHSIEGEGDQDLLQQSGRFYRLLMIHAVGGGIQRIVGAALLASAGGYPTACPVEMTQSVGHHLRRALQHEQTASLV